MLRTAVAGAVGTIAGSYNQGSAGLHDSASPKTQPGGTPLEITRDVEVN